MHDDLGEMTTLPFPILSKFCCLRFFGSFSVSAIRPLWIELRGLGCDFLAHCDLCECLGGTVYAIGGMRSAGLSGPHLCWSDLRGFSFVALVPGYAGTGGLITGLCAYSGRAVRSSPTALARCRSRSISRAFSSTKANSLERPRGRKRPPCITHTQFLASSYSVPRVTAPLRSLSEGPEDRDASVTGAELNLFPPTRTETGGLTLSNCV